MEIDLSQFMSWGLPLLLTLLGAALLQWILSRTFANQPNNRLYRQLGQLAVVIVTMIVLVLVLPINPETKGDLLSLFGLVLTAVIALSSTTFVSNAMAGVTLKMIGSFRTGDFIEVAEHFGRVKTKTILHTEIQSVDRDTVTLPNMYLMTNPVKVVDQSGTLISADVTIGYDVHRDRVRAAMLRGAETAGLQEPFYQILALGNFAIEYRVTGFLNDVNKLVSKRTELHAFVLDALHQDQIEVMTPNVMAQRPMQPELSVLPVAAAAQSSPMFISGKAERLMFDKADKAARVERIREQCETLRKELKALEDGDADDNALDIAWRRHQLRAQEAFLEQVDQESD